MKPQPQKFEPIATEPAYRLVARTIEEKIVSGEIGIGEPLPSEMALAARLGVHRSTVREAIRVLEQNGLVARRQGRKRLHATMPGRAQLAQRASTAMILQEVSFFELWEAMLALEPAAAAAAAERISEDVLERIADNLERTRRSLVAGAGLVELDVEFHDLVAEGSGNRALQLAREPVGRLFCPAFHIVMTRLNAGQRLLFAHERIHAALQNRAAEEARAWMERHIVDFRRGYELADLDIHQPVGRSAGEHRGRMQANEERQSS